MNQSLYGCASLKHGGLAACTNTESATSQRSEEQQFDAVGDNYVAEQAHVTRVDACMMRRGWAKIRAS